MNYEDKYNEALKWMRSLYDGLHGATKEDAEHYFPELKESEDEKIRKQILSFLKEFEGDHYRNLDFSPWIAWLEKHKHVDVKPHIPDGSTDYDKGYEEAQKYLSERGFDIPWNDGDVFVDERYIMQTVANVLAWGDEHPKQNLEKQSEQILANSAKTCKIEPKFKVGDWVVGKELGTAKILRVNTSSYKIESIYGNIGFPYINYIDRLFHLWTIDDAKDGDILITENTIIIYKEKDNGWLNSYVTIYHDKSFSIDDERIVINRLVKDIHPATEEQCDLLFQKMKESGYEWDAENRELLKIEQSNEESNEEIVEPTSKFKKGDWITCDERVTMRIVNIEDSYYEVEYNDGCKCFPDMDYVDKNFHLWTIDDAKDGDILYSLDSKRPFIFKHRKPHEQATPYCGINIYGKFFVVNTKDCIITIDKYIPADNFQRNLLFQKMKKAGYEWDAEKKELWKIDGLYCAKEILEKTLGKVEGYQSVDD